MVVFIEFRTFWRWSSPKAKGSPLRVCFEERRWARACVSVWVCVCRWVYEGQVCPHRRQEGLGLRLNLTLLAAGVDLNCAPPGSPPPPPLLHTFLQKNHKHLRRKKRRGGGGLCRFSDESTNTREHRNRIFFRIYFTCVVNRKIGWKQSFWREI